MYAIIEASGKQYKVEEGRYVDFELLGKDVDEKITFDKVVMLVNGKKSKVGQPYVANAQVYKQRAKKGYRRKQGHRQGFCRVMINKIKTKAEKAQSSASEEA